MSDAVSAGQVRSIIERILRLKSEQDAIGEDVKEVYAEAKSSGLDKTRLGEVVAYIRKREKRGAQEMAEADAIFGLYLAAYEGSLAPARARVEIIEEIAPQPSLAAPLGMADSQPDPSALATPMPAPGGQDSAGTYISQLGRVYAGADLEIPSFLRREPNDKDAAAVASLMGRLA